MDIISYFDSPQNLLHKQYLAVRAFLYEKKSAGVNGCLETRKYGADKRRSFGCNMNKQKVDF